MNNAEIRLRILFECYAEAYYNHESAVHGKGFEGVPDSVMEANKAYLIDRDLISGTVDRFPYGLNAIIGRILPGGVDIVEEITSRSLGRLGDPVAGEIRGSPDIQLAFWEKCVNVTKVCAVAVEVTGQILSAFG